MKVSRSISRLSSLAVVATAAVAVPVAPALAAPADVSLTVRVKIDEVGWATISERRPGQPSWAWQWTNHATPLNQWVEFRLSLPVGSTVYVAELDPYGSEFRDDEKFVTVAGQTVYTADLTVRQSGEPDNGGVLG